MAITDPSKSNVERLRELKQLAEAGILTQEEIAAEKQLILGATTQSKVKLPKPGTTTKETSSETTQPQKQQQVPPPRWIWVIVLAIAVLIGYLTLTPRGCSSEPETAVENVVPEVSEEESLWNEQELRSFSQFTSSDTDYEIMFDVDIILINNKKSGACYWYPAIYLEDIGEIKLAGANDSSGKAEADPQEMKRFANMNLRIKKRGSSWIINSTRGNTGIEGVYVGQY